MLADLVQVPQCRLHGHRETVEVTGLLSARALLCEALAVEGTWSALALVVVIQSRSYPRRRLGQLGVLRLRLWRGHDFKTHDLGLTEPAICKCLNDFVCSSSSMTSSLLPAIHMTMGSCL